MKDMKLHIKYIEPNLYQPLLYYQKAKQMEVAHPFRSERMYKGLEDRQPGACSWKMPILHRKLRSKIRVPAA